MIVRNINDRKVLETTYLAHGRYPAVAMYNGEEDSEDANASDFTCVIP